MCCPVNFHKANAEVCHQPGPEKIKVFVATRVQELFLKFASLLLFFFSIPVLFFFFMPRPPHWLRWSRTCLQSRRDRFQWRGREDPPGGGHGNQVRYCCPGNPRTGEPGGLQSTGSERAGPDTSFPVSVVSFSSLPLGPFCRPALLLMRGSPPRDTGWVDARDRPTRAQPPPQPVIHFSSPR